jgi:hypothetical protein
LLQFQPRVAAALYTFINSIYLGGVAQHCMALLGVDTL